MAASKLSPAKATILAVQLSARSEISTLRTLVFQNRKTLRNEIVLRILLSYLPESLDSSEYVQFLQELSSGDVIEDSGEKIDVTIVNALSEPEARKKVKKLHLLPLKWPNAPADTQEEPIVLFLIHRSLRIDECTGLITQIPQLLAPFLHLSHSLRTWMISTILPLVRLYYEYHPNEIATISISTFERLDDEAGVALLLSGARKAEQRGVKDTIGRDLKGLVGPWMYGDTRQKRRKLRKTSSFGTQLIDPLEPEIRQPAINEKCESWEEVFKWITVQATTSSSWKTAVQAIEQWDGPGDVDLGGYEDGTEWLDEEDQQHLERRFARAALAAAYLVPDPSLEALNGVHKILSRIIDMMDLNKIPTLEAAGALLIPVEGLNDRLSRKDATFLPNLLLDEESKLTKPEESSLNFLHAVLISAYLVIKNRGSMNVKKAAELALRQDKEDQTLEFMKLLAFPGRNHMQEGDAKFWVRTRNVMLWLRSWGSDELAEGVEVPSAKGIFGKVPKQEIEVAMLKALLVNNQYQVAQSIYENSDLPLPKKVLHDTVIAAAMEAYDNATNPNKTRGGVKKCNDILNAFPDTLKGSVPGQELKHLIEVTHLMGGYRLVFKHGEPLTPVILHVHSDPLSILGTILEQNPKAYSPIEDFLRMGRLMVQAGLNTSTGKNNSTNQEVDTQQLAVAEKRVACMCIDAALAEDDFETAYSYVMNKLEVLNGPAYAKKPQAERRQTLEDDWSWKAALQAGNYRRNAQTIKRPHTQLGNASSNPEIRHLTQRMDCLSFSLRCAPKSALQQILNAYRRCEEELGTHVKAEEAQEEDWDRQGDETAMPGGFTNSTNKRTGSRPAEEAPMSLFDLSRESMARAQNGLSALSMIRGEKREEIIARPGSSGSGEPTAQRERKRDQLKNAAVGTLASGVGWLIGAPPTKGGDGSP